MILLRTNTNELCSFGTTSGYTKGLYRKLSKAIASLPDGGDVQVGPRPRLELESGAIAKILLYIIFMIVAVIIGIFINRLGISGG